MRDRTIRQAFHRSVLISAHADPETIVVDELGLQNGAVRADIAVLNGRLIGYEIKTKNDTLLRLGAQVDAYSEVFDRAFAVVTENHLPLVAAYLPEWWGIYLIVTNSIEEVNFEMIRAGTQNPAKSCYSLAQLLWKDEAINLANEVLKHRVKNSIRKDDLYDIISATCSTQLLSKMVVQYLKKRTNWRKDLSPLS